MTQTLAKPRSYSVIEVDGSLYAKAWDRGVPMEPAVYQQARDLAKTPGVRYVAIMPDAHVGSGSCVGSVIFTDDTVIVRAVGVDIGCGMIAVPLNITRRDLWDSLTTLRAAIEARIPTGRTNNGQEGDRGAWGEPPWDITTAWHASLDEGYQAMIGKRPTLAHPYVQNHLGTLGTGNHFIEVCAEQIPSGVPHQDCPKCEGCGFDTNDDACDCQVETTLDSRLWIMLHSGSRGIGARIGNTFAQLADKECERWHSQLSNPALSFLPRGSDLFDEYLQAANWAQRYAWISRDLMLIRVLQGIQVENPDTRMLTSQLVHCHHNYVAEEKHYGRTGLVTRKGAVNAAAGTLGIIPGSMGARSYITRGLGNPDSLNTSSHGAGRVMSRTVANRTISLEEHIQAVQGVECRIAEDVIDETPAAYKPIDQVMAAQRDLTEPIVTLKQILVVKGAGDVRKGKRR